MTIETLRPFHETIIDSIKTADNRCLECLATLIKATKIPKNHDNIIAAWKERLQVMGWGDQDLGVPDNLAKQKLVVEKQKSSDKK